MGIEVTPHFKGGVISIPDRVEEANSVITSIAYAKIQTKGVPYSLHIPDSVSTIGAETFCGCSPMDKLIMGKVRLVMPRSFTDTSINEVYWSDNCGRVNEGCFNRTKINKFVSGSSLRYISAHALIGGSIKILDFSNTITYGMLEIHPYEWKVQELIPSYYDFDRAKIVTALYGFEEGENGVLRKVYV